MRITLRRDIPINEYIVYAELEINQDRPDIKDYLEKSLDKNDTFNQKIQNYLYQVGLLDQQNNLTPKGKEVLEHGGFPAAEAGKYQISLIQKDELIGNYVLAFKRMGQRDNQNLYPIDLENIRNKTFTSKIHIGKGKEAKVTSVRLKNLGRKDQVKGITLGNQYSSKLEWCIKDEVQTLELTSSHGDFPRKIPLEVPRGKPNKLMKKILREKWDEKNKALRITVNKGDALKKETLNHFLYKIKELSTDDTGFGHFETVLAENIPVIPDGKISAENWMMQLLQFEIRTKYLLPKVYEFISKNIINKERLQPFSIQSIPLEEFLENHINSNTHSYWNLAAPLDLNPFEVVKKKTEKIKEQVFHIQPKERTTLSKIAKRLMPKKEIRAFVYVDRYVQNNIQQESLEIMVETWQENKGDFPVLVYTKRQSKNAYDNPGLPNIQIFNFENTGYLDHDRYFIFLTGNDTWEVWKSTRSLDYLQFGRDVIIDKNIEGESKDGVTFVKVGKELLTQELKTDIENQLENI